MLPWFSWARLKRLLKDRKKRLKAYLRLHAKTTEVETVHVSDEINIDLAPNGTVYGIELLNANAQLSREDAGRLVLQNEATGERTTMKLPLP